MALNRQISLPSKSKQTKLPAPSNAQMYFPSVLGELAASLVSPAFTLNLPPAPIFFFQSVLPLVSRHNKTTSLPSPLETNSRSFQITGVAPALPGIFTFHTTLLV